VKPARIGGQLALAAALAATVLATGCTDSKKPKVDAATERAEALERAKAGPYGTQVNALEKAKTMGDDINKKASESVDKIEKDAK
jgi:outer membrane murein-binding lipoprotein Lpp